MNIKDAVVSNTAQCIGTQSCMNITNPYLEVGKLECHGYESCMQGNMQCYGEKSCFKADVIIEQNLGTDADAYATASSSSSNSLEYDCSGSLSCAHSTFTVEQQ